MIRTTRVSASTTEARAHRPTRCAHTARTYDELNGRASRRSIAIDAARNGHVRPAQGGDGCPDRAGEGAANLGRAPSPGTNLPLLVNLHRRSGHCNQAASELGGVRHELPRSATRQRRRPHGKSGRGIYRCTDNAGFEPARRLPAHTLFRRALAASPARAATPASGPDGRTRQSRDAARPPRRLSDLARLVGDFGGGNLIDLTGSPS